MRYVNRRRLVIVVVLAALFGAVLPYVMWAAKSYVTFGGGTWNRNSETYPDLFYSILESQDWLRDEVSIKPFTLWPKSQRGIEVLRQDCYGLAPESVFQKLDNVLQIHVVKIGWPFRAVHMCSTRDQDSGYALTETCYFGKLNINGALDDLGTPTVWPKGILWLGAIGNVLSSVLLFGGLYSGVAIVRAKWRINRGTCWKCGYLSSGAAVCPECGSVT